MKPELIEICGFKVQAHRRSVLDKQGMECRYDCNGNNKECKDYIGVEVPMEHYLVYNNEKEIK